jgi:hypothetical protein
MITGISLVFHCGKALFMMIVSLETVVLYLPQVYWCIERNLPRLLELFRDEAEPSADEKLKGQSHIANTFFHEASAPNLPDEALSLSELWHSHIQVGESHFR